MAFHEVKEFCNSEAFWHLECHLMTEYIISGTNRIAIDYNFHLATSSNEILVTPLYHIRIYFRFQSKTETLYGNRISVI